MIKLDPAESSELEDFLNELPTRRCGEGGCDACDVAFHASCDVLIGGPTEPVVEEVDWDGDTLPVIPMEMEFTEIGGEG